MFLFKVYIRSVKSIFLAIVNVLKIFKQINKMPIELEFQLQIAPRFHGWRLYVIRFKLCMKLMKKKYLSSY